MATVRIEHVAVWTDDIDRCLQFYVRWLGATCGARYCNAAKGFECCFPGFAGGARIEAMRSTTLVPLLDGPRRTSDGYYECVVLDPDGNRLELAASG